MFLQRILLLPLAATATAASCIPKRTCRASLGDPGWPSPAAWSALNDTLDGRLLLATPPGAVCHPGQPTYDSESCPDVAAAWSNYEFHASDPVSVMWDQYTNYTCLPDSKYPCSPAGYPAIVVNASTAEHVKLGIDFARENNIRLVVKGTGHDYLGRSIAPGALSIWTHHMNDITYHDGSFTLAGSGKVLQSNAVTVGGGGQMYDLYAATDKHNQTVVGGGGKTVGIGGYVTGGGHSILAPRYGLAVDNVLQLEMVTPGGDIVVANEDQNQDLFWASRGGGGSTFGVITSVTMKTHPAARMLQVIWMCVAQANEAFASELISHTFSYLPSLMDQGMSGYVYSTKDLPNPIPIPGVPDRISGVIGTTVLQDVDDPETARAMVAPINETVSQRWPGQAQCVMTTIPYDTFLHWFDNNHDDSDAGNSAFLVSRLLDGDALTQHPDELTNAIESGLSLSGSMFSLMVAGNGVQNAEPRGGSNAVNPGWRRAYIQTVGNKAWSAFDYEAEAEAIQTLNAAFEPFRELTPGMGTYINEALAYEKDWKETFWGDNYERLLRIKEEVDPTDVFWCFPCVGHDRWEQLDDGRLCKIE